MTAVCFAPSPPEQTQGSTFLCCQGDRGMDFSPGNQIRDKRRALPGRGPVMGPGGGGGTSRLHKEGSLGSAGASRNKPTRELCSRNTH